MTSLAELRKILNTRPSDGHKGTFGTVLLIGGSVGMTGSMVLAGRAALRAGAGLVRLAVPTDVWGVVASMQPEYTTIPLPQDADGRVAYAARDILFEQAAHATVVGIGPGLGRSEELNTLLAELWRDLDVPMVLDADGLNALAASCGAKAEPKNVRILTPHPGEFARLNPSTTADDREAQCAAAVCWAQEHHAVVVLKGAGTQISDGTQTVRNTTGNPGMGTGGSGDVLTGITAALYAQLARRGVSPVDIARLAVALHGEAGDRAAQRRGTVSLIASDLIEYFNSGFSPETSD